MQTVKDMEKENLMILVILQYLKMNIEMEKEMEREKNIIMVD